MLLFIEPIYLVDNSERIQITRQLILFIRLIPHYEDSDLFALIPFTWYISLMLMMMMMMILWSLNVFYLFPCLSPIPRLGCHPESLLTYVPGVEHTINFCLLKWNTRPSFVRQSETANFFKIKSWSQTEWRRMNSYSSTADAGYFQIGEFILYREGSRSLTAHSRQCVNMSVSSSNFPSSSYPLCILFWDIIYLICIFMTEWKAMSENRKDETVFG